MSERSERFTCDGRSTHGRTRTGWSHELDWMVRP